MLEPVMRTPMQSLARARPPAQLPWPPTPGAPAGTAPGARRFWALRRTRGLTLIELCIALAVLAILGAIALPGMGAQLARQRLHSTAQTLVADLADARFEATRRGQALHWQGSSSGGTGSIGSSADWCWALSTLPNCPCGQAQSCQLRNVIAADHPGITLQVASNALALQPAGGNTGNGMATQAERTTVATLENKRGDRLRVQVSALGRPQVCTDRVSATTWPQLAPC